MHVLCKISHCLKRYMTSEIYRHLTGTARGFRNLDNYRLRMLLTAGGLHTQR